MAKGGGRKYARDKNGRFASTGTTAKGGRLGGKKGSINLGKQRPGTSAPGGGTIARGGNGVRGQVARRMAGINGFGKGSKASASTSKAAPSPAPKTKKGPKTAAGRASTNLRNAQKQLAKNPLSKKAAMAEATARAAAEVYKARGTGRKGAAKRKGKK